MELDIIDEIKQEFDEKSCKTEIDNNRVSDVLFDTFKTEFIEEPKRENTNDAFDYLVLNENLLKTEIQQDEHKLFEEKQKLETSFPWEEIEADASTEFKDHIRNHGNLNQYSTANTSLSTEEKNNLTSEICSKMFPEKSNAEELMRIHNGKKSFACNICNKQLSRNYHLKIHMRMHTGEKPFVCEICEKQFSIKGHLKKHMGVHTGERPFACEICSKSFSGRFNLKEHMKLHKGEKPFGCDICTKNFSTNNHLKLHMRVHTGEKPFVCEICEKQFSIKGHLKRHNMQVHTAGKPLRRKFAPQHSREVTS